MGLQWAYRGMHAERVEKEKALTVEQSMPLQVKRELKGAYRIRIILPRKEVARKREGDGSIQPMDYHKKKPIEEVEEDEINLCCRK